MYVQVKNVAIRKAFYNTIAMGIDLLHIKHMNDNFNRDTLVQILMLILDRDYNNTFRCTTTELEKYADHEYNIYLRTGGKLEVTTTLWKE